MKKNVQEINDFIVVAKKYSNSLNTPLGYACAKVLKRLGEFDAKQQEVLNKIEDLKVRFAKTENGEFVYSDTIKKVSNPDGTISDVAEKNFVFESKDLIELNELIRKEWTKYNSLEFEFEPFYVFKIKDFLSISISNNIPKDLTSFEVVALEGFVIDTE